MRVGTSGRVTARRSACAASTRSALNRVTSVYAGRSSGSPAAAAAMTGKGACCCRDRGHNRKCRDQRRRGAEACQAGRRDEHGAAGSQHCRAARHMAAPSGRPRRQRPADQQHKDRSRRGSKGNEHAPACARPPNTGHDDRCSQPRQERGNRIRRRGRKNKAPATHDEHSPHADRPSEPLRRGNLSAIGTLDAAAAFTPDVHRVTMGNAVLAIYFEVTSL